MPKQLTAQTTTITPIETLYAGHRFRSRLEARWAVFFDHLGIKWQYEPQGYRIPRTNGTSTPYLPDFLLTDCGTWVEVKGDPRDLDTDLMRDAAKHLPVMPHRVEPGPRLMILGSIPEPVVKGDWGWTAFDEYGPAEWPYGFGTFHKNQRPWFLLNTEDDPEFLQTMRGSLQERWLTPRLDPYEWSDAMDAYRAARSARFEHGESP